MRDVIQFYRTAVFVRSDKIDAPMRWSVLFIPTLRECPVEVAAVSRQLLMRAGYLRQLGPGADAWLFLGQRSLARVSAMVRAEMDAMGAQQIRLPLPPNAVTSLARGDLRSYKQLPQLWYRRESTTNPGHSISIPRIWTPPAPPIAPLSAASSNVVGFRPPWSASRRQSMVRIPWFCALRAVTQRISIPPARVPKMRLYPIRKATGHPKPFPRPGRKTIAEISEFTGSPESAQIKSLVLIANGEMLLVLLRGDHQLSPAKFADAAGDPAFRPANGAEIRDRFGAGAGSLGPVGVTRLRILADEPLRRPPQHDRRRQS